MRNAFVSAFAETRPHTAAMLWPGHPAIAIDLGLQEIGRAAIAGRPVARSTINDMLGVARKAPLAPEPFLVKGVDYHLSGQEALAGRAFVEARRRDPRAIAPRYFLAEHFLRTGKSKDGLEEIANLGRLVPGGTVSISPYLASYAVTPGAVPHVRALLRRRPDLESVLLYELAANPKNLALIMTLASSESENSDPPPMWQGRLIQSLIEAGEYGSAYSLWARYSGLPQGSPRPLLFNPDFRPSKAAAPFNWTLLAGAEGVAEVDRGGLHVLYYGREAIALANQTTMLLPGRYRLSMKITGANQNAGAISWTVICLPSKSQIATLPVGKAVNGLLSGVFDVPAGGCEAQQLSLVGTPPEFPLQADLSIANLSLRKEGGR